MWLRGYLFCSAIVLLIPDGLAAQDTTVVRPLAAAAEAAKRKSEDGAMLRGIIPGAGHFYVGERGRGAMLASAFLVGVGLMAIGAEEEWVCEPIDPFGFEEECFYDWTAAYESRVYTGLGLSLGSILYSIVDARFAARRANRRNGLTSAELIVAPHAARSPAGASMVGISLRITR